MVNPVPPGVLNETFEVLKAKRASEVVLLWADFFAVLLMNLGLLLVEVRKQTMNAVLSLARRVALLSDMQLQMFELDHLLAVWTA